MANNPPVYIVDDDPKVCQSIRELLESAGYRVKVFENGQQFLNLPRPLEAGCILVDLHMPGMDGIELLNKLRSQGIDLPIIFITGQGSIQKAVQSMKLGAFDFIEKPIGGSQLLRVVNAAFEDWLKRHAGVIKRIERSEKFKSLTSREKTVLELLLKGHSNKCISSELKISYKTVEKHRASIMKKMDADSLARLFSICYSASDG